MLSRIVLFLAVAGIAAGCSGQSQQRADRIVAAFYPLAYAAQQMGGASFEVVNLTPPGVEPHDLELTPGQVADIAAARVVLYLGHGFQPGLEEAVRKREAASLDLLENQELAPGNGARALDQHIWLDPTRYAAIVRRIGVALDRMGPAEELAGRLEALDAEMREGLRDCRRREIVTSHAAFGYLAMRYDLKQVPLAGLSPEAEPTPKAVERLVSEVSKTGATVIFFETLVSPKLAQTVAREAGVSTAVLNPVEGLTDEEAASGADYFSIMRENLSTLQGALACR